MVSNRFRAVSTVADVSLALVIISAAVVMMGVFLQADPGTHEPMTADRSAETVAGMTVTARYNVSGVTEHSTTITPADTEIEWPTDSTAFARSRHDTMADLLAEAAIANATYGGKQPTVTDGPFEEAIDGRFRTRIGGADTNVHVTAIWRPYRGSSIEGIATAGPSPPVDADISSVTMTVPSGITLQNDVSTLHSRGEDRAEQLARRIVASQFPREEMVHSLESQGMARDIAVYRYYGFLDAVGTAADHDHTDDRDSLSRYAADPAELNEKIAIDASDSLADQMADEQRNFATDERFAGWLTIEDVEIVVRTWHA